MPVWEMLLQEVAKPGKEVRWEYVPAHVNVQGNEVAMDWRWKACAPVRLGPNKSHSNHHPDRNPRWG